MSSWEDELKEHFPGYLLPSATFEAITREAASRFLERLTGRSDALSLLLAASALAPVAREVRDFATELRLVARVLPSRTQIEHVESDSQVRGRLDVARTLRQNGVGRPHRVVSRVRQRDFNLPENVLLVATAHRLLEYLARLEERGALSKTVKQSWSKGFLACAESIKHDLSATVLREVSVLQVEAQHEQAARAASHKAYKLALQLHEALKRIDTVDPRAIAHEVAQGALFPFSPAARFELAVLIRLGRSVESALAGRNYKVGRALIEDDRSHVFEFTSNGDSLRIHYNHVLFEERGARDRGIQHYFGEQGRFRPDITLEWLRGTRRIRAAVVEVKYSDNADYLKEGYAQALLYRAEYAQELTGWPKAILVVSSGRAIQGTPRREDDVVAVDWNRWVPNLVLEGLLEGFGAAEPGRR
ncbi:hypothetical protein [Corallococcus sp. 4LFB]|uniref:hypothetical protein n=1 Tax=Corallococcus sp. 4LFB TaxID=3383249 RepID=UPI00397683C3